jgi:hypothetical protein
LVPVTVEPAKQIEEEGAEQFLVNLLYVLRECFQEESTE